MKSCENCHQKFVSSRRAQRFCSISCHIGTKQRTHGESSTILYKIWKRMRQRCSPGNAEKRSRYFDRGIAVCERWDSFENFKQDMGDRPSPIHSIDRKNNDLGYSPDNCRWATPAQQSQNTSTTVLTWDLVDEIRGRAEHGEKAAWITRRMKLTDGCVRSVLRGNVWRDSERPKSTVADSEWTVHS